MFTIIILDLLYMTLKVLFFFQPDLTKRGKGYESSSYRPGGGYVKVIC